MQLYLKKKKTKNNNNNKCQRKELGGDSWGVWDRHIHTAVFKMDNQQGPTV